MVVFFVLEGKCRNWRTGIPFRLYSVEHCKFLRRKTITFQNICMKLFSLLKWLYYVIMVLSHDLWPFVYVITGIVCSFRLINCAPARPLRSLGVSKEGPAGCTVCLHTSKVLGFVLHTALLRKITLKEQPLFFKETSKQRWLNPLYVSLYCIDCFLTASH